MRPGLVLQVLVNAVRFAAKRVIHGERFSAGLIQRISLRAAVRIHEQGRVRLGHNLCVSPGCHFEATGQGRLEIADRVYFNRGCMISCHEAVSIGAGCIFGPDVKVYDNDHCFSPEGLDLTSHRTGEIRIGPGTWVGANVVILRGTRIGTGCVIGAGAVVKGEIPDRSLVVAERNLKVTPIAAKER